MKSKPPVHSHLLRSNRGSVLLSAIIAGVVVFIMFFASTAYLQNQARFMAKSASKMDRRIVLDGLYAYTINGIKQNWCFTQAWTQDMNCDLNNPRNSARLLLSNDTLTFIRNSGTAHPEPLSSTRLNSISQSVTLAELNVSHPLYSITAPLRDDYTSVQFLIERDQTAISAVRGREVPIKVTVQLNHKSDRAQDQVLVSKNIVYPRELTYFGLILANDLFLNSGASNPTTGDNRLNAMSTSATGGLRFESPVFINGNLQLPSKSLRPAMDNVVFVDKVVLGGGRIMQDNAPVMPKTAGGEGDMYNYDMPFFAGLLGGYELDPARDTGLDFLYGLKGGANNELYTAQRMCRDRLMASYDLSLTNGAQLWTRVKTHASNTATVNMNLGQIDNFIEQQTVPGFSSSTTVPGVNPAAVTTPGSTEGTPVFKVTAFYNGLNVNGTRGVYTTDFYIHREGVVTLYPKGSSAGGGIQITSSPLEMEGRTQFNQVDLKIDFLNPGSIDIGPYKENGMIHSAESVKLVFEAYDYAYMNGDNLRPDAANTAANPYFKKKIMTLSFTKEGSAYVLSGVGGSSVTTNKWFNNSGLSETGNYAYPTSGDYVATHVPTVNDQNLASFDDRCFAAPATSDPNADFSAFPAADWSVSFATQSRHAWMFSPEYANRASPGYNEGQELLNGSNSTSSNARFNVKSLVHDCVVQESANFVTGFYTCENFIIQPRSRPLRIIGTVITNQLTIDPSAFQAGIRWSSIYHPQAVQELISARVLGVDKQGNQINCNNGALAPLWQTNIGANDRYAHYACNPISLRSADPFKWSTVDPDCGIVSAKDTLVKCKKQTTRYLIKEISRGKGL
ncbi:MAG: hypothetical protein J7501_04010 [Bdellovibrio sp.]|nr:hypothetical protein [Bdellovibrio sp.]